MSIIIEHSKRFLRVQHRRKEAGNVVQVEQQQHTTECAITFESPLNVNSNCSHKKLKHLKIVHILKNFLIKCQVCHQRSFKIVRKCLDCNIKIHKTCRPATMENPLPSAVAEVDILPTHPISEEGHDEPEDEIPCIPADEEDICGTIATLPTIDDTYKYWKKRTNLFHRFYEGILLDEESFYSVCPEVISTHIANQCVGMKMVIDPFCGAGGNIIQLARVCDLVIAIDIDPAKILLAMNNARVYNVYHKIKFVIGDFFEVGHYLQPADAIVTSPPWGGPSYSSKPSISPTDIYIDKILRLGIKVAPKILLHMPKNLNTNECILIGKQNKIRTYKEETIEINYNRNCKLFYFNSLKNNEKEHTNYSITNFDQSYYFNRNNSKEVYRDYLLKVGHYLDIFRQHQREMSSECHD